MNNVAYRNLSKDEVSSIAVKATERGEDCFTAVAARLFAVSEREVAPQMRSYAKWVLGHMGAWEAPWLSKKPALIPQDGEFDCGAACLAMALGMKSAKSAYTLLGYDPSINHPVGVSAQEVCAALRVMGYVAYHENTAEVIAAHWEVNMGTMEPRKNIPTEAQLRQRLNAMQAGSAIVSVPSLNGFAAGHFVFVYRGEIYDPSNNKRYVGAAQCLPIESVIFIEER